MIIKFGCKESENIWNGYVSKNFPRDIQQTARRKLVHVNSAIEIGDLRTRLEKLKGDLALCHSIRINQQWRIIFIWKDGNANDVKIVNYH